MHANGEVWPLWGTCFGMQVLSMLGAGTHSVVVSHPAESLQLPLALTPAAAKSQLLCTSCLPADVLRTLTTRNATVNLHNFGVDVESFQSGALGKAFSVLSTNIDTRGRMFASTIEAKGGAPIFGTQWHPERPQFEWTPGMIFIERAIKRAEQRVKLVGRQVEGNGSHTRARRLEPFYVERVEA